MALLYSVHQDSIICCNCPTRREALVDGISPQLSVTEPIPAFLSSNRLFFFYLPWGYWAPQCSSGVQVSVLGTLPQRQELSLWQQDIPAQHDMTWHIASKHRSWPRASCKVPPNMGHGLWGRGRLGVDKSSEPRSSDSSQVGSLTFIPWTSDKSFIFLKDKPFSPSASHFDFYSGSTSHREHSVEELVSFKTDQSTGMREGLLSGAGLGGPSEVGDGQSWVFHHCVPYLSPS